MRSIVIAIVLVLFTAVSAEACSPGNVHHNNYYNNDLNCKNTNWVQNENTNLNDNDNYNNNRNQNENLNLNSNSNFNNTNQTAGSIVYYNPQPLMAAPGLQRFQLLAPPSQGHVWNSCWSSNCLPRKLDAETLQEYARVKVRVADWSPFGKFSFPQAKGVEVESPLRPNPNRVVIGVLTLCGTTITAPAKLFGRAMYEAWKRGGNAIHILDFASQYETASWSKNRGLSIPVSLGRTNSSGLGTAVTFGPSGQTGYAKPLAAPFLSIQVLRAADECSQAKARAKDVLVQ